MPNVVIQTKRIVSFHVKIKKMIGDAGYDVAQAELACQSAVNDIHGKEGEAKIGDVKHKGSGGKKVGWRETVPFEFEGQKSTPSDFLAWHDSLNTHFKKHGEPKGDLNIALVPEILVFWLDSMRARKIAKAAKDKEETKQALAEAREQVKSANEPARGKSVKAVPTAVNGSLV